MSPTADTPESLLGAVLDGSHLAHPDCLPDVIAEAAGRVGWDVVLYLVDDDELELVPQLVAGGEALPKESVDGSLAGRCFRSMELTTSHDGDGSLWMPLIDGVDRLGVLRLRMADWPDPPHPQLVAEVRWFAHLVAHLLASKSAFTDSIHRARRTAPRSVASELIWSMLPPLTVACDGLVLAGRLEPRDRVAGDVFDYSIDDGVARMALADATGHDLNASLIGALILAAYRSGRRDRLALPETLELIDSTLLGRGSHTYATGVFAELELETGLFRYTRAGHPPPLLLRRSRVVKPLDGGHRILLGIRPDGPAIAEERLEPGDWVIFYTDGITEARDEAGDFFGLERLTGIVERGAAAQEPAPEVLRRITNDVLGHQQGVLQDDATLVVAQWRTGLEMALTATNVGAWGRGQT
jgi:sigma-B regulation protein RsbU (phosphoserine phosphatase)